MRAMTAGKSTRAVGLRGLTPPARLLSARSLERYAERRCTSYAARAARSRALLGTQP